MEDMIQRQIRRYHLKEADEIQDWICTEVPLTVYLNEMEIVTLLCSPGDWADLAVGFLVSEGVVRDVADLVEVVVDPQTSAVWVSTTVSTPLRQSLMGRRYRGSGCGQGVSMYRALDALDCRPVKSTIEIYSSQIHELMSQVLSGSECFRHTGGVHTAALCHPEAIVRIVSDIGRHNAVDRLIGWALQQGLFLGDCLIVCTGRISSEILLKCARQEIGVIVSRGATTSLAIELAEQLGITLVGFARGEKLNVYTGEQRVRME